MTLPSLPPTRRPVFLWPVGSGLLLLACTHLFSSLHAVHRLGDFFSHTLYQSFIGLTAILLLWRAFRVGPKRLGWWPPAVALGSGLCVEGLKRATRLPRPDGDPTGFPSGHTTFAYALAWLLTQTHPRQAPLWYGVALAIGWSRVEGQAHFPYQVLCGAVLGTVIGWGVSRIPTGRGGRGAPTL